ncbi:MAG: hypothetical protein NXI24_24715 [bacterium]|nr:hypothetical protein [bacterium]
MKTDPQFEVDGRGFYIMIASEVNPRDGIGVLLYEITADDEDMVLYVFRNDGEHKYEVTAFIETLPLAAVEFAIREFHEIIDPEFDPPP